MAVKKNKIRWIFYSFLSNPLYLMQRVGGQSLVGVWRQGDEKWRGNPGIQFQMLYSFSQSVEPPLAGPKVLRVSHCFHITLLRFHLKNFPQNLGSPSCPSDSFHPFIMDWLACMCLTFTCVLIPSKHSLQCAATELFITVLWTSWCLLHSTEWKGSGLTGIPTAGSRDWAGSSSC